MALRKCFRCKTERHDSWFTKAAGVCNACRRDDGARSKHGMTMVDKMWLADQQNGCAICGREDSSKNGWAVDHDHTCCEGPSSCSNCRRGLLCSWCNTMLGYAHDNVETLRRAVLFLSLGTRLLTYDEWEELTSVTDSVATSVSEGPTDGLTDCDELRGLVAAVDQDCAPNVRRAREEQETDMKVTAHGAPGSQPLDLTAFVYPVFRWAPTADDDAVRPAVGEDAFAWPRITADDVPDLTYQYDPAGGTNSWPEVVTAELAGKPMPVYLSTGELVGLASLADDGCVEIRSLPLTWQADGGDQA